MAKKHRYLIVILLVGVLLFSCVCLSQASDADSLPMLKAEGTRITNGDKTVILKGCNLGNWFAMEMWMMHYYNDEIKDQYTLEKILAERFGKQEKDRLMDIFRANWITEKDFEIIKSFGMNCVRLPVHYKLIEDIDNPGTLKKDAFKWLDYAVNTAEKYGLYTIICLHGAPGGQSNMGHCGRENHNKLWSSETNKKKTLWFWKNVAKKYRNRGCVAGYDILNEPWGASMDEQLKVFDCIYKAIRTVDKKHLVFIQGHESIRELGNPKDKNWKNVVYSLHRYPGIFSGGPPTRKNHIRFLKIYLEKLNEQVEEYNVPFLMGEFNVVYISAGGAKMMRRHFDAYENYGWGATMWAYKVLTIPGERRRGYWEMVTNKKQIYDIDFKAATREEIENYFMSLSSDYTVRKSLKRWLTREKPLPPLEDPPPMPEPLTSAPFSDKLTEFTATELNTAIKGGQKVYPDGRIDLYGCGADIYLGNDQFRFLWKKIEGDSEVSATVNELKFTHMFAKAGVMIRGGLDDDAVFAALSVRPSGEFEFIRRYHNGQKVKTDGHLGYDFPGINLKITRTEHKIESWYCKNGESWQKFMTVKLPNLPKKVYCGLFCLSHDNTQLTKASFDNVKCTVKETQNKIVSK